jgi:putative cardiolipin synthase
MLWRMFRGCALLLLLGPLVAGCVSVPREYPRTPSTALPDPESTGLGRYTAELAATHPGDSGFALIRHGRPAFTARVAFSELAEKTLDLQYYIWEADATGRILAERLVRAADRGVRVRVLLDDVNLEGRDAVIASLDAHPNIEIRLFNPFGHRSAHILDFITDFERVNHRMHNKLMVADNAVAIVGGRNVGDDYFQVATDANYRDLDIAALGPVVRDISAVYDHFFNGDWAVPIAALVDRPYTESDLQSALQTMRKRIAEDAYPYPLDQEADELKAEIRAMENKIVWAPGMVVWDDPASIDREGRTTRLNEALHKRVGLLENELLLEAAYFVPRDRAIETMRELNERGVRLRVLTNSMASNDVVAAHAGYANRRKEMLESGVALYELRPDAGSVRKRIFVGTSKAALHTKAIVFDRKDVFIGSFNLDPRSGDINTEAGLYIESPELAHQLIAHMDEGVSPQDSYRVRLDENGDLYWVTEDENENETRFEHDPGSTVWQRSVIGIIQLLPIEGQL